LKVPGLIVGAVVLPFRRSRKAAGISADADARKNEMLALTAGLTRTLGWARIRSIFSSRKRKAEVRRLAMERATAQAVEQLGSMKGLSMKLGQMMSYLTVLSEEGENQLADLQSAVPPMAPDLVRAVVEEQLGAVPERVFAQFDIEPIAAASVGQVHRARLDDGRAVAVKIQYPGVADAFRADLANSAPLPDLAALSMRADSTEYYTLIADSLEGELDYTLEQRNQQRLADMYRGHPYVVVPDTVPELCRPKVLVSAFVDGDRFQPASLRPQPDRDRMGEVMYRFAFGCIMNGFFSGDPHPGNYLFLADDRVCFLDFGMVMDISGTDHGRKISQIIAGALDGRQDLIDDGLHALGFLPDGGPTGAEVWGELRDVVAGPIEADAVTRLDRHVFGHAMKQLMDPRSKLNRASMKTEHFEGWAAIWMRYAVGALAAISKLAPEANWRQIVAEIVTGEQPQTEIGRNWGPCPGGSQFVGSRFNA
jgi:predicted unusual protein kinase regulating ubiquinone biosynthesis (AarF/ABC1/UbiB family)